MRWRYSKEIIKDQSIIIKGRRYKADVIREIDREIVYGIDRKRLTTQTAEYTYTIFVLDGKGLGLNPSIDVIWNGERYHVYSCDDKLISRRCKERVLSERKQETIREWFSKIFRKIKKAIYECD